MWRKCQLWSLTHTHSGMLNWRTVRLWPFIFPKIKVQCFSRILFRQNRPSRIKHTLQYDCACIFQSVKVLIKALISTTFVIIASFKLFWCHILFMIFPTSIIINVQYIMEQEWDRGRSWAEGLAQHTKTTRFKKAWRETNWVAKSTIWRCGGVDARYLKQRWLAMISSFPPDTFTSDPTHVIRANTDRQTERGRGDPN